MRPAHLLLVTLTFSFSCIQAQKKITLEDCFQQYKFYPAQVDEFAFTKDGRHYTVLEGDALRLRDVEKENFDSLLANVPAGFAPADYKFSENEATVLFISNRQPVYRHSYTADYLALDLRTKRHVKIGEGLSPLQYCELSPDGSHVIFIYENNLYLQSLINNPNGFTVQITNDGQPGQIINGLADWVYEEEFSPVNGAGMKAVAWSPDSKKIAFLRFDEREVPEFGVTQYLSDMYPLQSKFKYPKVGSPNSKVTVHLIALNEPKINEVKSLAHSFEYIPRIGFTPDNALWFMTLNRHQDSIWLWHFNSPEAPLEEDVLVPDLLDDEREGLRSLRTKTGYPTGNTYTAKLLFNETDSAYIDLGVIDYFTLLKDNKHFIWGSERDNTTQLYLYDMSGKLVRQLTTGRESITAFYGVDERRRQLYVQTSYAPVMRMVWEMPMDGGEVRILSAESEGWHDAGFSPTFDYWVHKDQNHYKVPVYKMRRRDGSIVRVLEDNADKAELRKQYSFVDKELFQIPINKGQKMQCWLIKPPDFDDTKKYPILIDVYGGPGSQTVTFAYDGYMDPWRQMLAQKGYLVALVDNRGTGGKTREFKKCTHMQLGKLETEDQILAGRYLSQLPWVDRDRVGIWGWSYGGYLSTNALFKGNGLFKMAIAVAPVTNWKWYNSAFTERYLHTYAENPRGFDENSPLNFADKLKGKYLLCHGLADDNVHYQHSATLMDALIHAGKQFETVQYPNRNHNINSDGATMHLFSKITDFILKNL